MIRPVGLVQINIVSLQLLQAAFEGSDNIVTIKCRHSFTHGGPYPAMTRSGDLCRQNDRIPGFGLQPPANDLFRAPDITGVWRYRIHLCGIKKVDTRIKRFIHNLKGCLLVCAGTKCHGAHTNIRDDNAASTQSVSIHLLP